MKYEGWRAEDLYDAFGVPRRSKSRNNLLIRKMIGITGDIENTQEFQKANMNLRVISVNKKGLPTEDSPFKVYDFIELAKMITGKNLMFFKKFVTNAICLLYLRKKNLENMF